MTDALVAVAAEIAEQHRLAQAHAGEAVGHARRAGSLLLKVKADVGHGGFLPWLAANATFTARTAQRYMNAAAPAPKCDRVSYSPRRPKQSKRALALVANLDRIQHRDHVLAHAVLVCSELPETQGLRPDDITALTMLRDRLNMMLEMRT